MKFSKLFGCIMVFSLFQFAMADTNSILGKWLTIDDVTNQARSTVEISEQAGKIEGKIIHVNYRAGESAKDRCIECSGALHNQLILGMRFMWRFVQDGNHFWSGGEIVDPKNGKTYRCHLTLSPDGKQLTVRGYIGLPLFGRSQVWYRIK